MCGQTVVLVTPVARAVLPPAQPWTIQKRESRPRAHSLFFCSLVLVRNGTQWYEKQKTPRALAIPGPRPEAIPDTQSPVDGTARPAAWFKRSKATITPAVVRHT